MRPTDLSFGARVNAGDVLAEIDPPEVDQHGLVVYKCLRTAGPEARSQELEARSDNKEMPGAVVLERYA